MNWILIANTTVSSLWNYPDSFRIILVILLLLLIGIRIGIALMKKEDEVNV